MSRRLVDANAALDAIGECPDNWMDTPEEIQAVADWRMVTNAIMDLPTVNAIPVEWLVKVFDDAEEAGDIYMRDSVGAILGEWERWRRNNE